MSAAEHKRSAHLGTVGPYLYVASAVDHLGTVGPYLYVASAVDHRGHKTGSWRHATVKGAMQLADHHAHPSNRVSVRAAYTSDATFQGEGRGREMAYREQGKWYVESYSDRPTEQPNRYLQRDAQRPSRRRGRRA